MPLHSILGDLKDFAIFGGIDPEPLAEVADLFEAGSYPKGEPIISEGDSGNRLYVVTSGRVQVSVRCPPPNQSSVESVLATHGRGATFGEMEMLDTQRRSASVTAIEPTETIELTNMGFYQVFLRDPEVFRMMILNIARDLSRRLRIADAQLSLIHTGEGPD